MMDTYMILRDFDKRVVLQMSAL